jgi:Tol biopolymer transport system component
MTHAASYTTLTDAAFCGHQGDGNWAVWVMNADGSNPHQLTHPRAIEPAGTGGDSPSAWSPDGKQIIYWSWQPAGGELFVVNSDGSDAHQLTHWDGGDEATNWLPDGRTSSCTPPQTRFWGAGTS